MYSILGWLNALLLTLMILPFILVRANKMIFKGKNKSLQSITKLLRKSCSSFTGISLRLS